ncbi:MAG: hypothetical protein HZB38_15000 [Planctomycetes bacterium]|nr:hypothetical protein [Planctomycetota bacterium]
MQPWTTLSYDAPCARCGYNLRGLSGDPICCPECGGFNPRAELERRHSPRARIQKLRGAGDAFILAVLGVAAGAFLWVRSGPLPLAVPVLAIAALLLYEALSTCRAILPVGAVWQPLFYRYVAWTMSLMLAPLGIWLVFTVLIWRIGTSTSAVRAGFGPHVAHYFIALAPAGLIIYFFKPLWRLRWRQRRAFVRLIRVMRERATR